MEELSLHILDIAQNSVSAKANLITINIIEDIKKDIFNIYIIDNGKGMDKELLNAVSDPFTTSRKERKVGLGIPLFKQAAEMAGGSFKIESELNKGTAVYADFVYSNIDRAPLGDIAETIVTLISGNPFIDFVYNHTYNGKSFSLSTKEIKGILKDIPINTADVTMWLKEYINDNLSEIKK